MCDRPRMIDNPYKGLKHVGLNYFHDCTSLKIPVPCGNCPTCIALRQSYIVQRCQMQAMDSHLFMLTWTYKNRFIPKIKVNDRTLYYADFSHPQKVFKRLRKLGLKFSYLIVSEYGGERHRPHFHAILAFPKGPKDDYHDIKNLEHCLHKTFLKEWRVNLGSNRKPDYHNLCDYIVTPKGRTYDLHYIDSASTNEGEADVAFYVTKYILKSDKWVDKLKSALYFNLPPEQFYSTWKLLKPRMCASKGFGYPLDPNTNNVVDKVKKHIRKGIELSKLGDSLFPYYISPINGKTFPLAPYYQKRFLTLDDKKHFFSLLQQDDGYIESDERVINMEHVRDNKLNKIRHTVNTRLTSYDFVYDDEQIENLSAEALEEDYSPSDFPTFVPDDWQGDFFDSL